MTLHRTNTTDGLDSQGLFKIKISIDLKHLCEVQVEPKQNINLNITKKKVEVI